MSRKRVDLSLFRYQLGNDGVHYTVIDTLPGVVVAICKSEKAARRRALALNGLTRPHGPRPPRPPSFTMNHELKSCFSKQVVEIESGSTFLFGPSPGTGTLASVADKRDQNDDGDRHAEQQK